jgi:hypothetical protein
LFLIRIVSYLLYLVYLLPLIIRLKRLLARFHKLLREFIFSFSISTNFLPTYYHRNELIWVDGFLLDFLQKKSADLWLRKFVIYTGFLFSERLVFEYLVKLYLDNLLWPLHFFGILEAENTIEMLTSVIFLYFSLFTIIALCCLLAF